MSVQTASLLALISLATGTLLGLRAKNASRGERVSRALLPLAFSGALIVAWAAFRLVPHWSWSAARLAASVRLAMGFPLYTAPNDPAVTGWIYGPVSAIGYLPAALANRPLAALQVAAALNAFYFLLPLFVVVAGSLNAATHRLSAAWLFCFGVVALLLPFGTWYAAAALNSDVLAILCGVLSCLVLARGPRLPVAAGLVVLAAWSKQIEAPLALAHCLFLAATRGWKPTLVYIAWLAGWGAATTLIFAGWFGAAELWHCLVAIPREHPIDGTKLGSLFAAFLSGTWWVWLLASVIWASRAFRPSLRAAEGDASRLLLLGALALLPGGLAAAAKQGGDQNSLHSISYAVLGGIALLVTLLSGPAPRASALTRMLLPVATAVALTLSFWRIVANDHLAVSNLGEQHQDAFDFARARPQQVYFPCNPLVTLMAERANYPFDYGLFDWRLSGRAPAATELRGLFPSTLRYIVYHEKDPSHEMLRIFSDFKVRRQTQAWDIWMREPSADGQDALSPPSPR